MQFPSLAEEEEERGFDEGTGDEIGGPRVRGRMWKGKEEGDKNWIQASLSLSLSPHLDPGKEIQRVMEDIRRRSPYLWRLFRGHLLN